MAGHFRKHGRNVLVACKAYLDGAQVGCLAGNGVQDVDEGDKSCSLKFKTSLKRMSRSRDLRGAAAGLGRRRGRGLGQEIGERRWFLGQEEGGIEGSHGRALVGWIDGLVGGGSVVVGQIGMRGSRGSGGGAR